MDLVKYIDEVYKKDCKGKKKGRTYKKKRVKKSKPDKKRSKKRSKKSKKSLSGGKYQLPARYSYYM